MESRSFTFKRQEPAVLLDNNTEVTARVKEAEFAISNSGNDMIRLNVELLNEEGGVLRSLNEYLVFSEKAEWKLSQFAESTGFADEDGKEVTFNEENLIGRTGKVRVTQETYLDNGGKEQLTNRIGTWLAAA